MRAPRGALIVVSAALAACIQARKLEISEVGAGRLELYLDEPANYSLRLAGQTLAWRAEDPSGANPALEGQIPLVDAIEGGQFVVVFEDSAAPPGATASSYTNFFNQSVRGIAVPTGALGPVDAARSYAFRVSGHEFRYVFPFFWAYDDTDDTVQFGPQPRPTLGGAWTKDDSLVNVVRTQASGLVRGRTLRRHTATVNGVKTPIDRNLEADWRDDDESFGTAD